MLVQYPHLASQIQAPRIKVSTSFFLRFITKMHKAILLRVVVILIRSTLASYPDPKSDTTSLASTPLLDPDCECSPQGGANPPTFPSILFTSIHPLTSCLPKLTPSTGICHPPSAKNCCNGFTCHFEPNGNYGLCQPPDAKDECLVEGGMFVAPNSSSRGHNLT